ncbi:MAG: cytochrome c family protein [Alphaproteobacteria bacterium]
MNLFEINKMVGAVLATGLVVFVINQVGDLLVSPTPLEKPAYAVAVAEEPAEEEGRVEAAAEEDAPTDAPTILALLGAADVEAGRKVAKKCAACHSFAKGGRNKVGPNLWDVVGGDIAGVEGYRYSKPMAALEGSWGYQELDRFLTDPKARVPGTRMLFRGLGEAGARANVILFLRSLSDSPAALPE